MRHWVEQEDIPIGDGITLRWKQRDRQPTAETTLIFGKTALVPVALRREGSEGFTVLANDDWFRQDSTKMKRRLGPGTYEFELEARRGHVRWVSRHRYALTVPEPGAPNEQFILEVS